MTKKTKIISGVVISLLIILAVFLVLIIPPSYRLYQLAFSAENNLAQTVSSFQAKDLTASQNYLEKFRGEVAVSGQELNNLTWLGKMPIIKNNYSAAKQILSAAGEVALAGEKIISLSEKFYALTGPVKNYNDLTNAEKEKFLQLIYQAGPELRGIKAQIELAGLKMQSIYSYKLVWPLDGVVELSREYLPLLENSLELATNFSPALPHLAGYDQTKTYLIIMQNNDELRPTGGFIGVYGILKIKNGSLVDFYTADSYSLDQPAEKYLQIAPPAPLKKYFIQRWFFRDANWSPDWPTSAKQILSFYKLEKGPESIDGVMALDPDFIKHLLAFTGPLTLNGIEFTTENFADQLQYEVEQQYVERGIAKTARKDVVNDLADQLFSKIYQLPKTAWLKILNQVNQDFKEKHLLFYDNNATLEQIYQDNTWTGEIKSTDSDYLMVIDANLGALKTDRVMTKKINYTLEKNSDDKLTAKVTLNYQNNGDFDYRTSRLRSYTRIYVPAGSQLINVAGARVNDRDKDQNAEAQIDTTQEFDKTVFGAFWYINPGETETLTFTYQLPKKISKNLDENLYTLFVQKQPGTAGHDLTFQLKLDGFEKTLETHLTTDRTIKIKP